MKGSENHWFIIKQTIVWVILKLNYFDVIYEQRLNRLLAVYFII
jgi:hypothetical protein